MKSVYARIPVRVTDCFLLANEALMRRTGQGNHISQSILELDRLPDIKRLRDALAAITTRHPILAGELKRNLMTWLPYWKVPPSDKLPPLPFGIWFESGSKVVNSENFIEINNAEEHLQFILNKQLADDDTFKFNARVDVILRKDSSSFVALTWAHRLIDGKGAELIFAEIARLCEGDKSFWEGTEIPRPETTINEKIEKTKAAINRFDEFAKLGVHSLGGPRPHKGQCQFHVIKLETEKSQLINDRAGKLTGQLFPLPFYLACAVRAHVSVFALRGKVPACQIASVPIQLRKRGARGPLFHNQVTILFFCALREHFGSLAATALDLKKQFAEMMRVNMAESFTTILELMMRVPSGLFMRIVRWQFKGEINSFYHSHTGAFAPEMTSFSGAEIRNAWHLPCLGSPPGTGIFFNERNGKLNIVLTWREGCVTEAERSVMIKTLMNDLLGEEK